MLLLVDMAVKGLVVMALAFVAARLLHRASAATRYLVWSSALLGLLALPLLGALAPSWTWSPLPEVPQSWAAREFMPTVTAARASEGKKTGNAVPMLPRPTPRASAVAPVPQRAQLDASGRGEETTTGLPAGEAEPQASPSLQRATSPANAVPTWPALLAGFYLLGVVALLLQLAAGGAGVLRILRASMPVADGPLRREFEQAVAELGIERDVRLLETDATAVPLAWELLRPVVLMPREAHRWPGDRRRVALLHELAHVKRRDCQVQFLAHLSLALHWPDPLAWLALRRLRREREHACDDAVLQLGTRASDYAGHLLDIARGLVPARQPAWASLAMARTTQLEGRVEAILDPHHARRLPGRRTSMTALIIALALLLPLAGLQPGVEAQTPAASATARQTHETPGEATGPTAQDAQPTVDELIQMRIHGVSTEFIEEVRAAFGRPVTVRELVQMRIHGTTPEFVREVQGLFAADVTIRDVTNLRIHGATIDYIRAMKEELGDDITVRDVTSLRIHGATPEFVREMNELLADEQLDVRDITSMCIHGVTVDQVRELQDDGFENLTARDLVQMKIHGFDRWLQRRRGGR